MEAQRALSRTWQVEGRHYGVTACTGSDKTSWELDQYAPAPGRGTLIAVEQTDESRDVAVWFESPQNETLPFEVLEDFVRYVRAEVDAMNKFFDDEQVTKPEER